MSLLDTRIAEWRTAMLRGGAVTSEDADELEAHLREQSDDLVATGLSDDEAFLVAVRRLGAVNRITAEFAREHSDRLWKQLVVARDDTSRPSSVPVMLAFAVGAAVVIQIARLAADVPYRMPGWFIVNLGIFVLVPLAGYFALERRIRPRVAILLGVIAVLLAVVVNVFPFPQNSQTLAIVALHVPVLLWLVVGAAYVAGEVRSSARRMDFIRFSGEWLIYYALIALGGAVLLGLTTLVLSPVAPDAIEQVWLWVLPSGAAGAVIVAAWLVESKKSIIENLAPVLTMIFTPLFALMLVGAVVSYLAVGITGEFNRDLLAGFDVLLLVVLGLVVYGISARQAARASRFSDVARLVAVAAALVLDVFVLAALVARIGDIGLTPNRVVALGLNLVLLVNLAVTAVLQVRMLAARGTAFDLERWQTRYLTVFAVWAAVVVMVVPPAFLFG
ncbi:MAG: permease prefix domain 1-containing protein [Rhodoglobus sp.]